MWCLRFRQRFLLKLKFFWHVLMCHWVSSFWSVESTLLTTWPWRWEHYSPSNCRELLAQQQSVTSHKNGIFSTIVVEPQILQGEPSGTSTDQVGGTRCQSEDWHITSPSIFWAVGIWGTGVLWQWLVYDINTNKLNKQLYYETRKDNKTNKKTIPSYMSCPSMELESAWRLTQRISMLLYTGCSLPSTGYTAINITTQLQYFTSGRLASSTDINISHKKYIPPPAVVARNKSSQRVLLQHNRLAGA